MSKQLKTYDLEALAWSETGSHIPMIHPQAQ